MTEQCNCRQQMTPHTKGDPGCIHSLPDAKRAYRTDPSPPTVDPASVGRRLIELEGAVSLQGHAIAELREQNVRLHEQADAHHRRMSELERHLSTPAPCERCGGSGNLWRKTRHFDRPVMVNCDACNPVEVAR